MGSKIVTPDELEARIRAGASNCFSCSSTVERPRIACAVRPCPRRDEIARARETEKEYCRKAMGMGANVGTRRLFDRRAGYEAPPAPIGRGNGERTRREIAERRLALRSFGQHSGEHP